MGCHRVSILTAARDHAESREVVESGQRRAAFHIACPGTNRRLFASWVKFSLKSRMPASAEIPFLKFTRLTEHAFPPVKGSDFAAGFDLKSAYDYVVEAHGKALIKTDLQIDLPSGCYGRVAPRSGLALKNFIDVGAGVIDEDYRGNVGVVLFNHSDQEFVVKKGDRIAQLICERIFYPQLVEMQTLSETKRGEGGFGSTGTQEVNQN